MKTFSKRGSALLIVLGLLSFLLISAVAFSISMRTEHSAASAYRRSLQARELLATVFASAQATLDSALQKQQSDNGFDRNNTDTYTLANLAPFKYQEADNLYGRLIASIPNSGNTPASHAYLLDDAVMSHVPPYVADAVYRALEENDFPNASAGETVSGEYDGYGIDTAAYWRAIKATVPKVENDASDIDDVTTTTVGRMAWAIINLSDSIDINAIGSASTQRGLGLTGSELGFGTDDSNVTTFDLLDSASDVSDQSAVDLPTFASNADLAQYAAMATSSMLITDNGGSVYPFSWVSAVEKEGPSDENFFSPFSVYSFYPSTKRADENGTVDDSASSGSSTVTTDPVSCNDITESDLTQGGTVAQNLNYLYNIAFYSSKSGSDDDGDNFVRLLFDYIDKDSIPTAWGGTPEESAANSVPTVENVPMVSEVAYDTSAYWTDEQAGADFATAIKDGIDLESCTPEGKESSGLSANDLAGLDLSSLKGNEGNITLTIPTAATITVDLRTYLPGYEELASSSSSSGFGVEVEGFVGAQAAGSVAGDSTSTFSFTPGGAKDLENLSPLSLSANALFENGSVTFTVPQDISFTIDEDNAAKILTGIKNEASDSPATSAPKTITLNALVDFFFRVKVTSGSDVVDLCPVAVESSGLSREREYGAQDYPADISERFTDTEMAKLDASYFRVTCPVSATFKLQWVITQESAAEGNQGATYSVALEFETEPEGTSDAATSLTFLDQSMVGGSTGSIVTSYNAFSPAKGAWYTVDPRYNWLSPMMGVSGAAGDYGVSLDAFVAALSSPHWLFDTDGTVGTSQTSPSAAQESYASSRESAGDAPFNWGLKVEDIRYGYNDLGQMLLPGEIGFIPVPLATSDWSPTRSTYNATSLSSYFSAVGRRSFFRTLPITDLEDSALTGESEKTYEKYADLMASIDSFSGDHFPEEHRGIANVFAAQDNYLLAQQLRQFTMLGIPRSIRAAAYNTYQRLSKAADISRVDSGILEDLTELKDLAAPSASKTYDTFVCNYLFPIERDDDYSWSGHTRPQNRNFLVTTSDSSSSSSSEESFAERFTTYNEENNSDLLGQNDLTTLLSVARESFGDRQQLFLFILRADALAATSVGADLSQATPISIARAVALVWRDAYGELPDRVIYYQVLP